jgi:hypothetical protein
VVEESSEPRILDQIESAETLEESGNFRRYDFLIKSSRNFPSTNDLLRSGFPNHAVYDAYIHPKVDTDHSKFTWAMPQLELIRE